MKLPIFPLPIFLLPGGITRLRIFEQRYLDMVRNCHQSQGFAIRYHRIGDSFKPPCWASHVEIIDFDMKADGVLLIDVKCTSLVEITATESQVNNLLVANVNKLSHWPENIEIETSKHAMLSEQLLVFFNKNTALSSLYQQKNYQNSYWLCCRWLELLPVEFEHKSLFTHPLSFNDALAFIEQILLQQK